MVNVSVCFQPPKLYFENRPSTGCFIDFIFVCAYDITEPNQDVTYSIAEDSHEHAPWVFSDKQMVPFAKVHDWKLTWEKERLTWSADNRLLLDVVRKDKGLWPTEALPLRWGPWATDAGWAGPLNWTKTPEAVMQLKSVKIEGCQLD